MEIINAAAHCTAISADWIHGQGSCGVMDLNHPAGLVTDCTARSRPCFPVFPGQVCVRGLNQSEGEKFHLLKWEIKRQTFFLRRI